MSYRLGIDLGGTGIKTGVIDENNRIICKNSAPTDSGKPFEEVVNDIAEAAFASVKGAGLDIKDFIMVGLGTPGFIDKKENAGTSGAEAYNVPPEQFTEIPADEDLPF